MKYKIQYELVETQIHEEILELPEYFHDLTLEEQDAYLMDRTNRCYRNSSTYVGGHWKKFIEYIDEVEE